MKTIKESILNYVKCTLDTEIWDLENDKLKPEVKEQIIKTLVKESANAGVDPKDDWGLFLIGSITGRQYMPRTDIDVTVQMTDATNDDDLTLLRKHFVKEVNGRVVVGTLHPINYFFRRDFTVRMVDGAYDIKRDEWLIKPKDDLHDPEKKFRQEFSAGRKVATLIVQVYEELVRDMTDLEELSDAMDGFYDATYWNKAVEVWYDLNAICRMYKEIWKARKDAFEKSEDPQRSMDNIIYKYLERYGYLDKLHRLFELRKNFIKALEDVLSTREVTV